MVKLTNKQIAWICKQVVDHDQPTDLIAQIYGLSRRRVQQLAKLYKETGTIPTLTMSRRPKTILSEEQKKMIDEAYAESQLGARLLRIHIKKIYNASIPQNKIHAYLLDKEKATPNPKKQKKRKRCRYERDHSLSLVHADWTQYKETHVIAYLDDASRRILSIGTFSSATAEHSIEKLKEAQEEAARFKGTILAVNTDRGSQFFSNPSKNKKKGQSQYSKYLEDQGIKHVVSRRNNPQTNGKIERWFREYKLHRHKFESDQEFIAWYNKRIHGALVLEWGEDPDEAFIRKLRPEALLGIFMEMKGEE